MPTLRRIMAQHALLATLLCAIVLGAALSSAQEGLVLGSDLQAAIGNLLPDDVAALVQSDGVQDVVQKAADFVSQALLSDDANTPPPEITVDDVPATDDISIPGTWPGDDYDHSDSPTEPFEPDTDPDDTASGGDPLTGSDAPTLEGPPVLANNTDGTNSTIDTTTDTSGNASTNGTAADNSTDLGPIVDTSGHPGAPDNYGDYTPDEDSSSTPVLSTDDWTTYDGPTSPWDIEPTPLEPAPTEEAPAPLGAGLSAPTARRSSPVNYGCLPDGSKCCFRAVGNCPTCPRGASVPSSAWGCSGELQRTSQRLLDWSYAGYAAGEQPLPKVPTLADVKKDFGAKGDGKTDDTLAFEEAIKTVKDGTLYIPNGTYVITKQLTIAGTNLVLRGAGSGKTTLYFPKSLTQVYGNTFPKGVSQYASFNAFIYFIGSDPVSGTNRLANITADAEHGATQLAVSNTSGFKVGSWVRIVQDDVDGELAQEFSRGLLPAEPALSKKDKVMRFPTRVVSVGKGFITVDRPMPLDVRTAWRARVHAVSPLTQEQGIEALTIRFPVTTYPGRYKEQGYNAVYFWEGYNAWVKDVHVENADMAIQLAYCTFSTISGVELSAGARGSTSGSYGIVITRGNDNLVEKFNIRARFWHDTYVSLGSLHTVIADGAGLDLTMELYGQPFGTLFANLNLGAGTRPLGAVVGASAAGAYNTFWNIASLKPLALPHALHYGPLANFITINSADNLVNIALHWFLEQARPLFPADLAAQQRALRVAAKVHAAGPTMRAATAVVKNGPGYGCHPTTFKKCCFKATTGCPLCPANYRGPSSLWGCNGELYSPRGRLIDWSYAGYRAGEASIPNVPVGVNVKNFGAKGDGKTDDTQAFKNAISQCPWNKAVYIPAGTYIITQRLDFVKSIVIRGAGIDKTILNFPKSMQDISGNTWPGGLSQWRDGPFFITFRGDSKVYTYTKLTDVIGTNVKGDTAIKVRTTTGIKAGMWIRLVQSDPADRSLAKEVLGNIMTPGPSQGGESQMLRFYTRVRSVGKGVIYIERPLPYGVKPQWKPEIHKWVLWVKECGLEYLTIAFPLTKYPGHFKERGYNAVAFYGPFNSWIRSVKILNADSNIAVGSTFMTVRDCTFTTSGSRGTGVQGHYGMTVWTGADVLAFNLNIPAPHMHDVSVNFYAVGVVYKNIQGSDMSLDHHKLAPLGTLLSNINVGKGTRPWLSGGELGNGPNSGAYGTWWNLATQVGVRLPDKAYGPYLNFVGVRTTDTAAVSPYKWFTENPPRLYPSDLHGAMVAARKAKTLKTS